MGNENGGYGVKAGRCIVAFMIFNFLVYKYLKTGLNWTKIHAKIMHINLESELLLNIKKSDIHHCNHICTPDLIGQTGVHHGLAVAVNEDQPIKP